MISSSLHFVLVGLGLAAAQPQAPELDVVMYRSFRPPNFTVIDGLFRVDPAMVGTPDCRYRVQLTVTDDAGTPLVKNEWEGRCPSEQGAPAAALETFQFAVVPARYTVEVAVHPEGKPEARVRATKVVQALPESTVASDLVLAKQAGWIEEGSESQWNIRKGKLGIRTASEIVATEQESSIAYYLEVYPSEAKPMTGRLVGVVRRADGRELVKLPLQQLDAVKESRPLAGNFSVAGLAPGEYVLEARLELQDTVLTREHPFRMATTVASATAASGAPAGGAGYFWSITDAELRRLFEPVVVFLDRRNRDLFERLDPNGRRRFLQQYFGGVEPTGRTADGNDLDIYLYRVKQVQAQFAERAGEENQEAWQTDRGRVFLLRGEPTNKVTRPVPRDGKSPYEIWQYADRTGYVYLFVDEARLGSYRLIYSSDPQQISLPDWQTRIGDDAREDLTRMGVRVPRTAPN
jgi:GWxTD domain-containing protein